MLAFRALGRPRRPFPPRAPRPPSRPTCRSPLERWKRRRSSPPRSGEAAGARPAGPGRRGRGRRAVDRAARRRRAARALCADAALARSLGWPTPLPLLAGELVLRRATGEGRRPRPGRGRLDGKLVALAYARGGARRPRPRAGPVAPRRPGSRTPRQNCAPRGRRARIAGAARRRRGLRRIVRFAGNCQRSRRAAAVRPPGRAWRDRAS